MTNLIAKSLLFFLLSTVSTRAMAYDLVDWGGSWDGLTDSGSYLVDGVSITLSTDSNVNELAFQPALHLGKIGSADQTYAITFSQAVNFSLPFGHLNGSNEGVTNFSIAPASVNIDALHSWDGISLVRDGSGTTQVSTLTWTGITGLSFDHRYTIGNAQLGIFDGTVAVPEPSSFLSLSAVAILALARRRRERRGLVRYS